jgi:type I restriction enzyme S subunit
VGTDYSESLPLLGDLPKHWEVVEFGSILDGGTRNGIYKKKEFHGRGDKIVNMGELFAFSRLFSVPMKRVELSEKEQEKFRLQKGDLLFARRSLVAEGAGKCSLVCEIKEPTTFESSIIRARPNSDRADSLYLFYLFRSPYGTYVLDTIRRQVAVAGITGTDLVKLPIPLPPLDEQKRIAHILGTLDDKIELNQQMNQTLEGIARALFKSWFIDFDPVRAKLDGRQPAGMDAETAALFPDEFEDGGAIGPIPKGWRVGQVQDIGEVICGKTPSTREPENYGSEMPFITIPDMHGKIFALRTSKYLSAKGVESQSKKTLPPLSICVSCIATPGLVVMTTQPSQTNQQINSVVPSSGDSSFYYFFALRDVAEEIKARGSGGSVFANLNKSHFSELPVLLAPQCLQVDFHKKVEPLLEKLLTNENESFSLASTRDALLPKLLSGEIRVKDAEQALEEVT